MNVVQIAKYQHHLLLSLKFFAWYGLPNTFTKTLAGGLSCIFVVSSMAATVVDGSKLFSFPVVLQALCHQCMVILPLIKVLPTSF